MNTNADTPAFLSPCDFEVWGWDMLKGLVCGLNYSENTCFSNGFNMVVNYSQQCRAAASVPLAWKWALLECLLRLYSQFHQLCSVFISMLLWADYIQCLMSALCYSFSLRFVIPCFKYFMKHRSWKNLFKAHECLYVAFGLFFNFSAQKCNHFVNCSLSAPLIHHHVI